MNFSSLRKPSTLATVVSATAALFTAMWMIFVWIYPPLLERETPKSKTFLIIVRSTHSVEEAKRYAFSLSRLGYQPTIRLSPNGYYAVGIGSYEYKKASGFLHKGIDSGILPDDSYLVDVDLLLGEIPLGDYKGYHFIHAGTYSTKSRAFQFASELRNTGYESEVFLTNDGFYAIVLGKFLRKRAVRLRVKAIDSGHIPEDSYLTIGKEYVRKVTPDTDIDFTAAAKRGIGPTMPTSTVEEKAENEQAVTPTREMGSGLDP